MNNWEQDKQRAERLLALYCDERTDTQTKEEIRAWFVSDISDEAKDAALVGVFQTLRPNMAPDAYEFQQFEKIAQRLGFPEMGHNNPRIDIPAPRRRLSRITLRIAAVLLPAALLVGGYFWYESAKTSAGEQEIAVYQISVPSNEQEHLVLTDGTEVTLNEDTEFEYNDNRECSLQGEAYFKVAKSNGSFVVHAGHLDVTVLGTEFNISAYDNDGLSAVTLYSGRVKIDCEMGDYTLEPGKEFVYNNITGEISIRQVGVAGGEAKPSWIENAGFFQAHSLGDIFSAIESSYGITIENKGIIDTSLRYTFRFDGSEPLDLLMSLLKGASGEFDYTITGNSIIIEAIK